MENVGSVVKRDGDMNNFSINLDITTRCTLECPHCRRQLYKLNGQKVPGYDMTMVEYEKVIKFYPHIIFCGNASDPVFHPQFTNFLAINYERGIGTEIHHAATGKSLEWYRKAFEANSNAKWCFGLDGFPENSDIYRKNQKGQQLFEAMKLCAEMGLHAIWRYIIFRYNEDDQDECKKIADYYNIEMQFVRSSRFSENDPLKPTKDFIERKDYDELTTEMLDRTARTRTFG